MMRTIGFLAGVCLTVAAMLLVVDGHERQRPEMVAQAGDNATPAELAGVVAAIAEQVDVVHTENESDQAVPPDAEAAAADGEPQSSVEASGPDQDERSDVQAEAQADASVRHDGGDASTYLFWSPFRSEWAAQGFAGRLTSATQVPVEVVHTGPANYRVAFSYQDETERLARINRIETITGLKLE